VQIALGLETLLNLEDTADLRLNGEAAVRASISGNLQLETKFTLRFDNQPVPGKQTLDTITQLSLIYSLL
jgi:putative salt-induced outer membrane protein YdiY